jgi:hypothetical protein
MAESNRKIRSDTDRRDDKGRFGAGNPGKPRGARNRVSAAAEAIIDDSIGDVTKKCVELAKEGNTACILAVLKLRIPALKERSVQQPIALPPLATPQDALKALRTIASAVARAEIDGDHARSLVATIEALLKTFQVVDYDERLRALEAAQAERGYRAAA